MPSYFVNAKLLWAVVVLRIHACRFWTLFNFLNDKLVDFFR